jgi:HD-GYP domain-containing protein (c-di-GMP phosphodiesterase class II)
MMQFPILDVDDSLAEIIQNRLQSAFGFGFDIFERSLSGWQRAGDAGDIENQPAMQEWLESLYVDKVVTPIGRTIDGHSYLAVYVQEDSSHSRVVLGRINANPLRLAESAAKLAMKLIDDEANEQQELIDQYAERLSDSFEELTFLRKLSRHVEYCDADRSLADAAEAILPQLCELTSLESLCLVKANDTSGPVEPCSVIGKAGPLPHDDVVLAFLQNAGPTNRRVLVRNRLDLRAENPENTRIHSIVSTPVEKDGQIFGWLMGFNKKKDVKSKSTSIAAFGDDEIGSMEASLLEAAALMLGSHAANNRLFKEKEDLVVDIIHTLVGVIEAKDAYTCGHSDRVALIARRIAMELGLPASECQEVFMSGLLHDIGKIAVADDILLKPKKLTEEEYSQVKLHPERGARLLQGLKPLERLIPGVLHHHEAVNGTGYPIGLRGEAIPLMARILAVADAFDAMTSNRPYRPGMPLSRAESILQQGAGELWDAQVVQAYFRAQQDIVDIGKQWQDHLRRLLNLQPAQGKFVNRFARAEAVSVYPTASPPLPLESPQANPGAGT